MAVEILHVASERNLADFAADVFRALGISDYGEHQSDNYFQGIYMKGEIGAEKIKIAFEDDPGFDDFQFWVVVQDRTRSTETLGERVSEIIYTLLQGGYVVAVQTNADQNQVTRKVYRRGISGEFKIDIQQLPIKL